MKQLEFCFAVPTCYRCDCTRCKEINEFASRINRKINVDYENSDIAKAIKRAKEHLFSQDDTMFKK